MTASYQHLPLAQVEPGMVLSDELLDVQGHILLPQGTVLTQSMLDLMPRHGITMLPIAISEEPTEEELAAVQQRHLERLAHLFRKNDPDSDQDWATGLLFRFVKDYRLGSLPKEE
ncbi:hypothetical protein GCM10027277_18570 [Pseudoduganella ginsengisoli]|uniref:Uncharacterized protein n=1 Tax=Pseudoduganella ginsengisoli TaxID=1462440 RepID=A0A6L6PUK5_9BURK|nr:hypothetical protein [Pseudoduganella ginsengisoli]MTW00886.1 hypothetical protein [Pseudoduganella ginsengisoli]